MNTIPATGQQDNLEESASRYQEERDCLYPSWKREQWAWDQRLKLSKEAYWTLQTLAHRADKDSASTYPCHKAWPTIQGRVSPV